MNARGAGQASSQRRRPATNRDADDDEDDRRYEGEGIVDDDDDYCYERAESRRCDRLAASSLPNQPDPPPATTLLGQQDQCDPKLLRAHRAQRSFLRHIELERRCKGDADVQDSARHGCLHAPCSLNALSGDVYGVA